MSWDTDELQKVLREKQKLFGERGEIDEIWSALQLVLWALETLEERIDEQA